MVMSGVGPGACNKGQPAPGELLRCKSIASFAEKLLKDVFWKKNPSHASGVPAQCLAVPAQPLCTALWELQVCALGFAGWRCQAELN